MLVKKIIAVFLYYSGIAYLLSRIIEHKTLTYHNVMPDCFYDNKLHLGVSHSSTVFESHIKVLSRFFGRKKLKFSFDDGYLNNYLIAIPILEKQHLKGLFFVPFFKNNSSKAFWADRLMYLLSYTKPGNYYFDTITIQLDEDNREKSFSILYAYIMNNYGKKLKIMECVDSYLQSKIFIESEYFKLRFTFIDDEQINAIKESGHQIGFHSLNHDIYSQLSNEDIYEEFLLSKERLDFLNVNSFSFPFGGELENKLEIVEKLKDFNITNIYSNQNKRGNPIHSRISLPNTSNTYLIIFYYIKNSLNL
ncbi:polysaccharide deacetylase family protein [Pedobacter changchengzhani]|uniref:Polysaccharide deacetylase family protein n=1 Tax=Pedobacter changchengzhani TaxID=2529274 RepID=A0A4R5MPH5_9SPHI|nr:polysaccharide deacetylase family protein [Pedobacter changchengzhani]TDG37701.1 polysaccharide deacetylase family protein [Pedobacter changchengzhani]